MLAEKLLATAMHPNTPDAEALSALRKLAKQIDKSGGVASAFGFAQPRMAEPLMSFNQKRQLHQEAQAKLDVAEHRIEELERELTKARAKIESHENHLADLKAALADRVRSGPGNWMDFSNRARVTLGITSGWAQEFSRQTGVSTRTLDNARVSNHVPKNLIDLLAKLKPAVNVSATGQRLSFSVKEVAQIRRWAEASDDAEIAQKASVEFARAITEGHIRKLRSNLRNQTGGYIDPAYGGALPVSHGYVHRRGQINWNLMPDLELHVCREFISGESATKLARYASEKTGYDISPNQITQRVYNSAPPEKLIREPNSSGPLTWPEVWLIGHARVRQTRSGKGWLAPSLKALGIDPAGGQSGSLTGGLNRERRSIIGTSLADLDSELVQNFRASFTKVNETRRSPGRAPSASKVGWASLSPSERRIIEMLADGKTVEQTARLRATTPKTVGWHLLNIREKLGARTETEAVRMARKELMSEADAKAPSRDGFNANERRVLELAAREVSSKDIADMLDMSERMVHVHLANIRKVLGVKTNAELREQARLRGYGTAKAA